MKYYIGTLSETNGEYEYTHTFLIKTEISDIEALEDIAANWYEDQDSYMEEYGEPLHSEEDIENGDYYFNGAEVCINVMSSTEIDAKMYNFLNHDTNLNLPTFTR